MIGNRVEFVVSKKKVVFFILSNSSRVLPIQTLERKRIKRKEKISYRKRKEKQEPDLIKKKTEKKKKEKYIQQKNK